MQPWVVATGLIFIYLLVTIVLGGVANRRLTVDLESCRLTDEVGLAIAFRMHEDPETHEFRRYCLLNGLDEIDLVLGNEDKIAAFEERRGVQGGLIPR